MSKPDWVNENDRQLDKLKDEQGYEWIAKVLKRTHWYKWSHIKIEQNVCKIIDVNVVAIEFSWSHCEPKIYFNCGAMQIRLNGEEFGLCRAFEAVDLLRPVFMKMCDNYEL